MCDESCLVIFRIRRYALDPLHVSFQCWRELQCILLESATFACFSSRSLNNCQTSSGADGFHCILDIVLCLVCNLCMILRTFHTPFRNICRNGSFRTLRLAALCHNLCISAVPLLWSVAPCHQRSGDQRSTAFEKIFLEGLEVVGLGHLRPPFHL